MKMTLRSTRIFEDVVVTKILKVSDKIFQNLQGSLKIFAKRIIARIFTEILLNR